MLNFSALGDAAMVISLGEDLHDEIHAEVMLLTRSIRENRISAILDIVPAYNSVTLFYDPLLVPTIPQNTAYEFIENWVKQLPLNFVTPVAPHKVSIPVCYSLDFGYDLRTMAEKAELSIDQVISLHTSVTYTVYMMGFLPGFPYMGTVDSRIALPRHSSPRAFVEKGSVGIAGKQTGIYPVTSPGGWQIIGRTPLDLFSAEREKPVTLAAGDEVTFYSISKDEFEDYKSRNS